MGALTRASRLILEVRPESAILPNFGPKPRLGSGAEGRISGFSADLLGGEAPALHCRQLPRKHDAHWQSLDKQPNLVHTLV